MRLTRENIIIGEIDNSVEEINGKDTAIYDFYIETWFDVDAYFGTETKDMDDVWVNFYVAYIPEYDTWKFIYYVSKPDDVSDSDFTDKIPSEDRQLIIDMICEKLWIELEDIPFKEENRDMVLDTDFWAFWESGVSQTEIWEWFDRNYSSNLPELIHVCDRLSSRSVVQIESVPEDIQRASSLKSSFSVNMEDSEMTWKEKEQ